MPKTHKKDEQPELSDEQQQSEGTADLQTPAPDEVNAARKPVLTYSFA